MSVTDKIKALLSIKGKKNIELAAYLGISSQSMQNKFSRGSFSAEDLIKIADFLNCTLTFNIDDSQKIILDSSDIRENNTKITKTTKRDKASLTSKPLEESNISDTHQKDSPDKQYKKLTDADLSEIDFHRLVNDPVYQIDIASIYGMNVLAEILEKARQQSTTETPLT